MYKRQVFSSLTGNTKKLAEAIYEVLPKDKCDHFGETGSQVPGSDLLYICLLYTSRKMRKRL